MKRALTEDQKDWLMDLLIGWMNRVSDLHTCHLGHVTWRDHLAWFLDGLLTRLWGWLYDGSAAELRSVYAGEIPPSAMNERQLKELFKFDFSELDCICWKCPWTGSLLETDDDFTCPECHDDSVALEPFEELLPVPLMLMDGRQE